MNGRNKPDAGRQNVSTSPGEVDAMPADELVLSSVIPVIVV